MLKLDILVPVILILCLLAVAYILSQIFGGQEAPNPEPREIVLDPSRYTDDDEAANVSNTPDALTDGNARSDNEINPNDRRLDDYYDDDDGSTPNTDDEAGTATPDFNTTPTVPSTDYRSDTEEENAGGGSTTAARTAGGRYLVIAGSFRQKINAQSRVKSLKRDGFSAAEVGYTNRGAYAVALVDATDSYGSAKTLADRVRREGYEVFIKTKR